MQCWDGCLSTLEAADEWRQNPEDVPGDAGMSFPGKYYNVVLRISEVLKLLINTSKHNSFSLRIKLDPVYLSCLSSSLYHSII